MGGFAARPFDLIVDLGWSRDPTVEDTVCGKIEAGQNTDWLASSLFKGGIVYS
jgi:hypothetical protein